jgi:peptide/nickel transport system substrate-binding protein
MVAGTTAAGATLAACTPAPTAAPTAAPAATTAPTKAPAATTAPTAAPTKAPAAGPKVLKVRLYSDIANMDPSYAVSQNDWVVADCIMNGLINYGPNSYDIVNALAESVKQVDAKTIEFKLKQGIKWQKGYGEVTSEDVKFSYERIANPAEKSAYKDDWAVLDKVEITDKYSGKIILKEPFAPLWKTTLPLASGWVVCKKYVQEVGKEKYATNIIGTGPYVLDSWTPKQKIVVKKNPDYWGKPFPWDEIHFFPIDDDKAGEVAIEAGELDFSRVAIGSIDRFQASQTLKLIVKPALRYRWIGLNVEHAKLKDINVRQAVRYGIDVESIVKAAYKGKAEIEYAMIPPGLLGYWADAPKYKRDVAKAKEFMAKAGKTSLDLKLMIQDTTEYKTWAEIAQQNLKEVGINLTIDAMDSSTYWGIIGSEKGKDIELYGGNFSLQPDPSWATMWFTCEQVGIWNAQRWCNKEYDDLGKKGVTTTDDKEREKIYIQMQQIWDKDCHAIWITHGVYSYAYNPKTVKPATTPHGYPQAVYFEPAS